MEVRKGQAFRVPVRMLDSGGAGVTGLADTDVTVYIQKQGGSSTSKSVTGSDWFEIDATNMPGVYDLLLSASDLDTEGYIKYSVSASGSEVYVGVLEVVYRHEEMRWKIDTTLKQLIMYEEDGTTIARTYDLKDSTGAPHATNIFERVPA